MTKEAHLNMWAHGPWAWFPSMWIFPLVFLVVVLLLTFRGNGTPVSGARAILDQRYARGEIGQDEYQRMKLDLERD